MHNRPPYVEATEHLPVRALIRGARHDAAVLGWRGDRVYLTWPPEMGKRLGWVPAAHVVRPAAAPSGVLRPFLPPALTAGVVEPHADEDQADGDPRAEPHLEEAADRGISP